LSVRLKLALTIVATGLVTALLVIATVLYAYQRFEREVTFQRASGFLMRITATYDDVLELRRRKPEEFDAWLRNLVLYEPDTQLYLLDPAGTVLASTGKVRLAPDFKVSLGPVLAAMDSAKAEPGRTPFVMGDDPERMDADAVVAAEPLRTAPGRDGTRVPAGYLYLVAHRDTGTRWMALRSSFALPSLALIGVIVGLTTVLAALVIASVTRPLQRLTAAVATLSERGLEEGGSATAPTPAPLPLPPAGRDEFGRLAAAFQMLLATLQRQWDALRRLDHFRRQGVSNLSHDLRSPLTATAACLETLESRWSGDTARAEDARLVGVALRNTRNAARLVQSLGDLAKLDEPEFRLHPVTVDVDELVEDIRIRFAERAARQQATLHMAEPDADAAPPHATLDVELFERAVANLIDNALKYGGPGTTVGLGVRAAGGRVEVTVEDDGPGIAIADQPWLFDRYFQSRAEVAPATGEGGRGLGLAIVKRIAELHGGEVRLDSRPGAGTRVTLAVPVAGPPSAA
jgi:signal transduction histidine kinase